MFAQSWDQAMSPTAATTLLDTIGKLFALAISPQQYADTMNGSSANDGSQRGRLSRPRRRRPTPMAVASAR